MEESEYCDRIMIQDKGKLLTIGAPQEIREKFGGETSTMNEIFRDNSTILIGAVLPIILILLIGYEISLDVKNVPISVVFEDFSPNYVTLFEKAKILMNERKVDAILVVPQNFSEKNKKTCPEYPSVLH